MNSLGLIRSKVMGVQSWAGSKSFASAYRKQTTGSDVILMTSSYIKTIETGFPLYLAQLFYSSIADLELTS